MEFELWLAGLLIGVLVGLPGMGGGSSMTPVLVVLFDFKPTVAIGPTSSTGAIFKSVGAARHRTLGTVQGRLSGWMLLGSAPTSLLGVGLATWLKHRYGDGVESATGHVLGGALILGGLGLIAKGLFPRPDPGDGVFSLRRASSVETVR